MYKSPRGGGGPLDGGVRHASWNPISVCDFRPDQKFDALFQTWPLNQYIISDLPCDQFPRSDPDVKCNVYTLF